MFNKNSLGKKTEILANGMKDGDKIFQENNINNNRDSLYQKFASREVINEKADKQIDKNTYKIRTKGF